MILSSSPPWVIGLFTAIVLALFYIIKWMFNKIFPPKSEYANSYEERIFSTQFDSAKTKNMIERIDYWIEYANYIEANNLCNIHRDNHERDERIEERKEFVMKKLQNNL